MRRPGDFASALAVAATLVLSAPISAAAAAGQKNSMQCPNVTVAVTQSQSQINATSAGAAGNRYGLEDGRVVRTGDGVFHMVSAEMVGDPKWVDMRLGAWESPDGWNWERVGTLRSGTSNYNGTSQLSSVWGPMYIFDPQAGRWTLLYVGYRGAPSNATGWLGNYYGTIWLAYSAVLGDAGINGPYEGDRIILEPTRPTPGGPWAACEGLQGTDSMFAYQLPNGTWFALYGTAHTENGNSFAQKWVVCGATSDSLNGTWARYPAGDPVGSVINITAGGFTENPITAPMPPGAPPGYFVVFDHLDDEPHSFGFSCSADGVDWEVGAGVPIAGGARTPLGMLPMTSQDVRKNMDLLRRSGVDTQRYEEDAKEQEEEEEEEEEGNKESNEGGVAAGVGSASLSSSSALYWLFYTVVGPDGYEDFRAAIVQMAW